MAQTFDTSRVGGGTYELEQDSNGNYKLKSVGFAQVNKLNLPDLATSDTSVADTTKKATEDTVKAQTTEVFKPMNTYGGGADQQDTSTPMLKTADVKEPTIRSAGDPMTNIAYGQTKADQAAPQENIGATDSIQPQYQDGILRGQTGVKYSKPPSLTSKATSAVQDTVSGVVDSVKNNKALQMSGRVLGAIIANPVFAGAKMVAGSLTNQYQSDLNNANKTALTSLGYKTNYELGNMSDPGRIAGNPANNVFAGMNAVSAFGDISKGAQSRIDTRTKTATKKAGTWSKEKLDKFNAKTETFKQQKDAHDKAAAKDKANAAAAKAEKQKATQGPAGSGGGGGGGGGRVICTDLHRTGELSTKDWIRDTKFTFKTLSKTHVKGYLLWAEPTVKHIQKYPRYRKMWKHIAQHRANDIAWRLNEGKFDLLGRIYAGIGEPICWVIGNFVSDKQINKYNLTHWRRA